MAWTDHPESIIATEINFKKLDFTSWIPGTDFGNAGCDLFGGWEANFPVTTSMKVCINPGVDSSGSLAAISDSSGDIAVILWNGAKRTDKNLEWEVLRKRADKCPKFQFLLDVVVHIFHMRQGRWVVLLRVFWSRDALEGDIPAVLDPSEEFIVVMKILEKAIPGVWNKAGVAELNFSSVNVREIVASDDADIIDKIFDKSWTTTDREAVTQARSG